MLVDALVAVDKSRATHFFLSFFGSPVGSHCSRKLLFFFFSVYKSTFFFSLFFFVFAIDLHCLLLESTFLFFGASLKVRVTLLVVKHSVFFFFFLFEW